MGLKEAAQRMIEHEGLEPRQTPFRITDKKMGKWTSMFDDTIKVKLDPNAQKSKGRENFLYVKDEKDVHPAVTEQLRRYAKRNKNITLSDAAKIFDQTGAKGKIEYLKKKGINVNARVADLDSEDAFEDDLKKQVNGNKS